MRKSQRPFIDRHTFWTAVVVALITGCVSGLVVSAAWYYVIQYANANLQINVLIQNTPKSLSINNTNNYVMYITFSNNAGSKLNHLNISGNMGKSMATVLASSEDFGNHNSSYVGYNRLHGSLITIDSEFIANLYNVSPYANGTIVIYVSQDQPLNCSYFNGVNITTILYNSLLPIKITSFNGYPYNCIKTFKKG